MNPSLDSILKLVGKLDDTPSDDPARERFRQYLKENILQVGQLRDYIEECLRSSGTQQNRALQDLINYVGAFLGFEVTYGRYSGVTNENGYDGYWKSSNDFHIVIEVKTTEVYPIKAASLDGYISALVSDKIIPNKSKALGLYVVGRPDPEIRQLENNILAEKRVQEMRIISAESLLSLAEMVSEYDVSHDDVLAILRPSGPTIDTVVNLMARLVAEPLVQEDIEDDLAVVGKKKEEPSLQLSAEREGQFYWITPVSSDDESTSEDVITKLVKQEKVYAFSENTPVRKGIKVGDLICFYAVQTGVVAHATVASDPENKPHPKVRRSDKYPWTIKLDSVSYYFEKPVLIDPDLRKKLDAFEGKDLTKPWSWFVKIARKVSQNDFSVLTRKQ